MGSCRHESVGGGSIWMEIAQGLMSASWVGDRVVRTRRDRDPRAAIEKAGNLRRAIAADIEAGSGHPHFWVRGGVRLASRIGVCFCVSNRFVSILSTPLLLCCVRHLAMSLQLQSRFGPARRALEVRGRHPGPWLRPLADGDRRDLRPPGEGGIDRGLTGRSGSLPSEGRTVGIGTLRTTTRVGTHSSYGSRRQSCTLPAMRTCASGRAEDAILIPTGTAEWSVGRGDI